jgi:hypothetical protein
MKIAYVTVFAAIWGSIAATPDSARSQETVATPAPTPGPSQTLWRFLGIPQTAKRLNNETLNRNGRFPGLEPKPPLKPLADPENLKSDNPAIKKAAEVKKEEDLAKQKIKAIKYLAKIGCGCHNRDGGITDALMKSMDDCTEEVRYETIKAVSEAARETRCFQCQQRSCCSPELGKKLAEIAYEMDDQGCYLEPSERVRAAAEEALAVCCPGRGPIEDIYTPLPKPEGPEVREPKLERPEPTPALDGKPSERSPVPSKPAELPDPRNAQQMTPGSKKTLRAPTIRVVEAAGGSVPARFAAGSAVNAGEKPPRPVNSVGASRRRTLEARLSAVDAANGLFDVAFKNESDQLQPGDRIQVYHDYLVSGRTLVAVFEVRTATRGGLQFVPHGNSRLDKASTGDFVAIVR